MPSSRLAALVRRCAALLAATLAGPGAMAQGGAPPSPDTSACAVLWQVSAVPGGVDGAPLQLQLGLRFQAGGRSLTGLHLPGGWSGHTELPAGPGTGLRLQPRPGEPTWRDVAHAPGETVQLQWLLQPTGDATQGGHVQTSSTWLAFSGLGVLPMPDGAGAAGSGPACVALQGLAPGSRFASSHGTADGPDALWRLGPSPVPLAQRVQQSLYAGGALQWQAAPGVVAVLPSPSPWPMAPDAVAQAATRVLDAQQRQWPMPAGPETVPPWLVLVLPAAAAAAPHTAPHTAPDAAPGSGLASAWHHALALQLPPAWVGNDAALQALLTQAAASAWTAERFGPLAHAGRGDAALRAWFTDGWAGFLAHRALLREGLWTPDDFATALNARLAAYLADPARALPNAQLAAGSMLSPQLAMLQAMRGEWLALHWHQALRRAGHPGLDAVLRQQLVPAAQARREGPMSAPLATHRVVASLRGVLQDQPLRDLQLYIEQGQPFGFGTDSLGPCFQLAASPGRSAPPTYRPVAGALQQPACQGWLGLGPQANVAAPLRPHADGRARAANRQAIRQARGTQAAAKPGSKATAKAGNKAGKAGKSGKPSAKPGAKPAKKPAAKPAR
ncbi:MAG: hypothetical protein QE285_18755 [Aquabacterium sp.]|nr:hypothetical protein [Aquabacterium sp.]